MRLNSLYLCNFRQHVDTRIEFETGITGIIGPNGAGKSTILEAIAWALYGMPAARGTRESIRSYRASPRATVRVDLDFELGGHRYLVSRGLTNAELYLDGAPSPIATSISGVTELLRRRLGMSHEEFFNTYFTGQKELSVMAAMSPAERAQFLSRVLGYERLRTAQGLIRERRRSVVAEASGLRAGLADPAVVQRALTDASARRSEAVTCAKTAAARRDSARRTLDDIAPKWSAIQRERDAMQTLVAELRVADGERSSLQRDEARLDRELAETAEAKEELERLQSQLSPLPALQIELRELDRACNEEGRRKTLIESESALGRDIVQIRERLLKIESAPTLEPDVTAALEWARAELEQTQREFEERRTDWVRDQQEAETKRQSLLEQLQDVQRQREQIVELGEGGTCPICARPLGTHFRSVLDVLDQQIESITVDGKYYRGRIEQLQQLPPELGALDERRRAIFENIGKLERRLAKVQAAVQELATLTRDLGTKEERYVALTRERALVEDRERTRGSLRQIEARVAALSTQRDALAFSEESYAELRLRHEDAAAQLRDAELAAVAADSDLAAAVEALEVAERARA